LQMPGQRLKVGFISDAVFPWHVGGLEATERTEAEVVAKRHEVHFLSMRWPGMKSEFTDHGISYHAFIDTDKETFYSHGRRSIRVSLLFVISCFRIFGYRFDVIVANMFPFLHLPVLKLYCKLTGCRLVIDVAEVWTRDFWVNYIGGFVGGLAYEFSEYFFRSADFYICNADATKNRLIAEGVGSKIIGVFSPILDDMAMARIRRSAKKTNQIVFVGRLIKEKRVDLLLRVLARTKEQMPDIRAVIIGDGPEKKAIAKEITRLGLSKNVRLLPFFKDANRMYKEIACSSLFLQMSGREGLSRSTLESIALGTPVVAPKDTPLPEEVSRMCQIAGIDSMPALIKKITRTKNPSKYIRNSDGLAQFYSSSIPAFYSEAFRRMGLLW